MHKLKKVLCDVPAEKVLPIYKAMLSVSAEILLPPTPSLDPAWETFCLTV